MYIQHLDLSNFGPFTHTYLDFTTPNNSNAGLHIVYGLNEAGKSSALRGLIALLYGFENKTSDNFLHSNKELSVSGTLLHSDGSKLTIRRRKGTKHTLLDSNGQPLDDSVLNRFVGQIDKHFFQAVFGIDHARLREGGQEILAGGGSIGEALFAAGTGITGLRQLAINLHNEASEIFKPHGKNQTIAVLKQQYDKIRSERDAQTLRGTDWQAHDLELRQAQERVTALNRELTALKIEQTRLERIHQALPHIARRQRLLEVLATLQDAMVLSNDFVTRRTQAADMLEHSTRELAAKEYELATIDSELQRLEINPELLKLRIEIERLSKQSGQLEKDSKDLPALQIRVQEQKRIALNLLKEIRPDLNLTQVEAELSLSKVQRNGIRELGNRYGAIENKLNQVISNKLSAEAELATQHQMLERLGSTQDISAFNLPTLETINMFQDEFIELANSYKLVTERLNTAQTDLSECKRQLAALSLEGEVPTEAILQQARTRRDAGWQLVRRAWLNNNRDVAAEAIYAEKLSLPVAYEHNVKIADELADRLRREATRVQQQAQIQADYAYYQDEIAKFKDKLANIQQQKSNREQDWNKLWANAGVANRSPKEMRDWLQRRDQILIHIGEWERRVRDAEQAAAMANKEMKMWRGQWETAIKNLGLKSDASPNQANIVLEQIDILFQTLKEVADNTKRINDINRNIANYEQAVSELCAHIATDLVAKPALSAVTILHVRLQETHNLIAKQEVLMRQAETARKNLLKIQLQQRNAESRLQACLQEASCESYAALPAIEARSMQRLDVEREYAACRQQLSELSGGKGEIALLEEISNLNMDAVPSEIENIHLKIKELETEREVLNQTIGAKRAILQNFNGRSDAAEKQAELEQILAALRRSGERYLQLQLASIVLEQQIEIYRQQNQTPLLNLASKFFAGITGGAFHSLNTTFTEHDRQVLCGLRSQGNPVMVEGMSDGTRDQLFLALRLARIQTYIEQSEPIPLIMDDILVHYDDIRSTATLQILAKLAERTQVIMFTHHQHLLELINNSVPKTICHVTTLP